MRALVLLLFCSCATGGDGVVSFTPETTVHVKEQRQKPKSPYVGKERR